MWSRINRTGDHVQEKSASGFNSWERGEMKRFKSVFDRAVMTLTKSLTFLCVRGLSLLV